MWYNGRMPNHCNNQLTLKGSERDIRDFARDHYRAEEMWTPNPDRSRSYSDTKSTLDMGASCPFPEPIERLEEGGWYDWSCQNWGTKWGAYDIYPDTFPEILKLLENQGEDATFDFHFDTAWSPPLEWLKNITHKYPSLTFTLQYSEHGCDFMGVFSIKQGIVDIDLCESISDSMGEGFDFSEDGAYEVVDENIKQFFQDNA